MNDWEREQEYQHYLSSLAEREAEEALQEEVIKPMKHKVMTLVQPMDSANNVDEADATLETMLDSGYAIEHFENHFGPGEDGWLIERIIVLVKRTPEEPTRYDPAKDDAIPF